MPGRAERSTKARWTKRRAMRSQQRSVHKMYPGAELQRAPRPDAASRSGARAGQEPGWRSPAMRALHSEPATSPRTQASLPACPPAGRVPRRGTKCPACALQGVWVCPAGVEPACLPVLPCGGCWRSQPACALQGAPRRDAQHLGWVCAPLWGGRRPAALMLSMAAVRVRCGVVARRPRSGGGRGLRSCPRPVARRAR